MSPSADYLLDAVLSKALELPASARKDFLKKELKDRPELLKKALVLIEGLEKTAPPSFLDVPPVVHNMLHLMDAPQPEEPDPSLKPGDTLNSYKIVKLLEKGGMGEVYLGERTIGKTRRKAAIKVIRSALVSAEVRQRFIHEQQILASLQHPNIATLYDVNVADDGMPFLAMEYIEGRHIDDHCNRKALSIEERLKLFKTVCDAVQYVQDNLVVHRDLKPSNILVTKSGEIKLLDFGIAKLRENSSEPAPPESIDPAGNGKLNGKRSGNSRQTKITQVQAPYTPAYAAPEQFHGDQVNAATDVYALGVILFELLTGLRPEHPGETKTSGNTRTGDYIRPSRQLTRLKTADDREKGEKISRQRGLKKITHLRRRLAGDLDTIVVKALEENGKDRYASAGELGRDIRRYLDRKPIQARPQTLGYRSAKFIRRYHRTAIATGFALIVLIGGIFTTLRQANMKEQATLAKSATIGFIDSILEKVDPDQKEGYSFTTKDLIFAGLSALQHIQAQPLVHADVMNEFGKIALNARLFDLADSLHTQALSIQKNTLGNDHPDLSITYTRIAQVYSDKNDYQNATLNFLEALALDSKNHIARNNLGTLLRKQGKFEEAAEQYNLAYQIAPDQVLYLRNVGASFFSLEQWEKAKNAYLRSIELEPHYNAFASLATIFYTIDKDYANAVKFYKSALDLNDQDYDMWGFLASAQFALDPKSPAALAATQKAIDLAEEHLEKLDPNDPYVHVALAGYYGRAGNIDKALFHLEQSLESPNIDDLVFDIGYAYEIIGDRTKALDYIEKAVDTSSFAIYILNEPALESLRQSAYFQENMASKLTKNMSID